MERRFNPYDYNGGCDQSPFNPARGALLTLPALSGRQHNANQAPLLAVATGRSWQWLGRTSPLSLETPA